MGFVIWSSSPTIFQKRQKNNKEVSNTNPNSNNICLVVVLWVNVHFSVAAL